MRRSQEDKRRILARRPTAIVKYYYYTDSGRYSFTFPAKHESKWHTICREAGGKPDKETYLNFIKSINDEKNQNN